MRCAIYTRKSSEEGLEQEFNSLDAQREACAAYILSQRHEGWALIPELYDDGGYSGGSMDRPGLQQLLSDVKAGKVDIVVVYKADRLTRSLADFARIVDILDAADASFVSVTQAFNTTTSMGRLTLNVLLSFAQFEREVTGERIRDKIAASKRKGIFMGGTVPLGYDVCDRKLIVNEAEAETVRMTLRRYLELGSVAELAADLRRKGIHTKPVQTRNGIRGGIPFRVGGIRYMLKSRTYLGEIVHKGQVHPGTHEPIVDRDLWEQVQQRMADQSRERRNETRARHPSLLSGILRDGLGRKMSPSHSTKGPRYHRYYITHAKGIGEGEAPAWRVPGHDLERMVIEQLGSFLSDPQRLHQAMGSTDAQKLQTTIAEAVDAAARLPSASPSEQREILLDWIVSVRISDDRLDLRLKLGDHIISTSVAKIRRKMDVRLVIAGSNDAPKRDEQLVTLIADAMAARTTLLADPTRSLEDAAKAAGQGLARFKRLLRLSWLAPEIVGAILKGEQPEAVTAARLSTITHLPLDWAGQKALLGFAA